MVELISIGGLLLAFVLVVMNGVFVAAEFAFVKIRPTRVNALVDRGTPGAGLVQDAIENLDGYLAVSQLGITLSSLGLGWIGEPAVAALIEPILGELLPASVIHLVAFALGFGFITFLHVVFGELVPKTFAIQEAERVALLVAPFMKVCYYLFLPGLIVFNGTANSFTSLVGVSPASESEETHSEEEIRMILTRSEETGHVDLDEVEMIESVFSLDDTTVREIMRPRPDVTSIPEDTSLPELRSMAIRGEYTRYPIVSEDEEVVGFVDVKDILRASETIDETVAITARDLSRDVIVVPETLRVDQLLAKFQAEQRQMAAVIDEWGSFEGLVTVEDVVEVIVGDIRDQFDLEESVPSIERLDDGAYAIDGDVPLTTVNEHLQTTFESDNIETVGGFVLSRLGRAPAAGDRIETDTYEFRIDGVDGARITELVVTESNT